MRPLERKQLLKEQFNNRKTSKPEKEFVSFKDLNIKLDPQTINWYSKECNGGANIE